MRVSELMTDDVYSCSRDDDLAAAAKKMWDHDCGALPVLGAGGRVVAMITDRDICMAAFTQGKPLSAIPVWRAASQSLRSARPDDSVESAEATMRTFQLHRLPVIDGVGKLVGIISLNDLAREANQPGPQPSQGLTPTSITQTLGAIGESRAHGIRHIGFAALAANA